MNGWQFLDYVRKDLCLDELKLPVIVMSAVESVDLDMEYMRHRANDWLVKPIQPLGKLAHKIMALLGVVAAVGENPDDVHSE
jgi:CheY-like chemotaxis protein